MRVSRCQVTCGSSASTTPRGQSCCSRRSRSSRSRPTRSAADPPSSADRPLAARAPPPRSAAASASHRSGEHMTATTTYRARRKRTSTSSARTATSSCADVIDPAELDSITALCDQIIEKKETLAFDWAWEKGQARDERDVQDPAVEPDDVVARAVNGRPVPHVGGRVRLRTDGLRASSSGTTSSWRKPPQKSAPTLWHQDEGYWGRNLDDLGITCWMPFHDVDERNGCMHFIDGGQHDGVLEHPSPTACRATCCIASPTSRGRSRARSRWAASPSTTRRRRT